MGRKIPLSSNGIAYVQLPKIVFNIKMSKKL